MQGTRAERKIVDLRRQIRAAGELTSQQRVEIMALGGLLFLGCLLVPIHANGGFLNWLKAALCFSGIAVFFLALPYAAVARRARRARLRRQLRTLPAEQRAEVLSLLRHDDPEDTHRIVEALRRELEVPRELSPVAGPEGRGSEVTG